MQGILIIPRVKNVSTLVEDFTLVEGTALVLGIANIIQSFQISCEDSPIYVHLHRELEICEQAEDIDKIYLKLEYVLCIAAIARHRWKMNFQRFRCLNICTIFVYSYILTVHALIFNLPVKKDIDHLLLQPQMYLLSCFLKAMFGFHQ